MDGGAWWATVHGVAKSWRRLSNLSFTVTTIKESVRCHERSHMMQRPHMLQLRPDAGK